MPAKLGGGSLRFDPAVEGPHRTTAQPGAAQSVACKILRAMRRPGVDRPDRDHATGPMRHARLVDGIARHGGQVIAIPRDRLAGRAAT